MEDSELEFAFNLLERLENLLLEGAEHPVDDAEYRGLRRNFLMNTILENKCPGLIKSCRSSSGLWREMKNTSERWSERRSFVSAHFRPIHMFLKTALSDTTDAGDITPTSTKNYLKTDTQTMIKIFISHSSRDENFAKAVFDLIRRAFDLPALWGVFNLGCTKLWRLEDIESYETLHLEVLDESFKQQKMIGYYLATLKEKESQTGTVLKQ